MKHAWKNLVVVVCLLAMGGFGTWILLRPRLPRGDGFTDGEHFLAAARTRDELRLARWDAPQLLAQLSDGTGASDPFFDPASGRIFFVRGEEGGEELWLAVPERAAGPAAPSTWVVRALAELNSPRRDLAPFFADGWLWFASDRAGGAGGLDLWRAPLAGDRFLAPENVGAPINTYADETDPVLRTPPGAVTAAAVELWFSSNREAVGTGDHDLLFARSDGVRFAEPELPETLQSPFDERAPAFAPDGRLLVFASDRPGGAGGLDLWRALWKDGAFQPPANLGSPNGAGDESGPALADDGFTLLFASDRDADGRFELLQTRTRELFPVPGPRFTLGDFTVLLLLALVALIAWLARRWEALDVLYKCMVVSLLVHLLFLWWTRRIDVEAQAKERGLAGDVFEIHVLGDLLSEVAKLEDRARGETVEVAATGELASAPSHDSALPDVADVAPSDPAAVARPAIAAAAAPPAALARSHDRSGASAATSPSADPIRVESESFERLSGGLAQVPVSARPVAGAESAPTSAASFAPAAPATAESPLAAREAPGTGAPRARPQDAEVGPAPAAAARELAPDSRARDASAERPVAMATPDDRAADGRAGGDAGGTPSPLAVAPAATIGAGGAAAPASSPTRGPIDLETTASIDGGSPRPEAPLAGAASSSNDAGDERPHTPATQLGPASPAPRALGPVEIAPVADARAPGSADRAGTSPQLDVAPAATSGGAPHAPVVAGPAPAFSSRGSRDAAVATADADATDAAATGPLARASTAAEGAAPPRRDSARPDRGREERAPPPVALAVPREPATGGPSAERPAPPAPGLALAPSQSRGAPAALAAAPLAAAAPARASLLASGPQPELGPKENARRLELPVAPAAAAPAPADLAPPSGVSRLYERRFGDQKQVALKEGGGSEETERAVLAGLRYLAKVHRPRGFFGDSSDVDARGKYRDFRVGKTGLCVLAFLGAGHTHRSGTEFSENVERALAWLLSRQDADSGHFGDSEAYSHGIATYALAECYAITHDDELRVPLEAALNHLLAVQQRDTGDPRKDGGWTYYYPEGPGFDAFPRASISAWQVMALESAKVGGFEVPEDSLAAARVYFQKSFDPGFGGFRYTHNPSWISGGYGTLPASTPASMFALTLLGEKGDRRVAAAEQYVLERLPNGFRSRGEDAFVRRGQGNVYFWYYSTLALFCRGGAAWRQWNDALKQTLLPAQQRDGSWDAIDLYSQRYAHDDREDKSYTTSMCVLMLEVYYRYFTPLLGKLDAE